MPIRVPKTIATEVLKFAHERDAMSTDKPKVSAYVPQAIKDRVKEFADEHSFSESQALTAILAEYFGIEQALSGGLSAGGVALSRMEALEEKIQQLATMIEAQQSSKAPSNSTEPRQLSIDPLNDIFDRHYGNGKKANARVKH
jgi:hypothetical protein